MTICSPVGRLLRCAVLLLVGLSAAARADDFLDPDQAFQLHASVQDAKSISLHFTVAHGYYLYRERFHFTPLDAGVKLGEVDFPAGETIDDPNLGQRVTHYRDALQLRLPVQSAPARFVLRVTYQGCADAGLCYPPIDKLLRVSLSGFGGAGSVVSADANAAGGSANSANSAGTPSLLASLLTPRRPGAAAPASSPRPPPASSVAAAPVGALTSVAGAGDDNARIARALQSGRLGAIVPLFMLFGLLLAFTPCVLPMIPILSGIIVGHGAAVSRGRGLLLASSYALGMALVYTAFGVAAGLLGHGLAAALQNPWVLSMFAAMLVLMALSMFGFYELQLPATLQSRLSGASGRLHGGHLGGVFAMGGVSALIVGPCVAAPLAGSLLYISQTGNALVGGIALFSLAAGMSLPLLLVGVGAGELLPRAGAWMDGIKAFFGVLLIATALYMIASLLPSWLLMLAWAALLLVSASFLHVFDRLPDGAGGWQRLFKGLGLLLALAGAALVVGLAAGNRDLLQPLRGLAAAGGENAVAATPLRFEPVRSVAELDARLAASRRPVLLDFSADWCVSCVELERNTFPDPRVAARLEGLTLLRADVTDDSADARALLARFGLFGPPGIIVFKGGRESGRVVGYEDASNFLQSLARAGV